MPHAVTCLPRGACIVYLSKVTRSDMIPRNVREALWLCFASPDNRCFSGEVLWICVIYPDLRLFSGEIAYK